MITHLEASDNRALQQVALDQVRQAQANDPFLPVTLVVPSSSQGWILRRQLVASLPPHSALANVRIMTIGELVRNVEILLHGKSEPFDALAQAVAVERLLAEYQGPLAATAANRDSIQRLMTLADELSWCALTPDVLKEFEAVSSMTSAEVIKFIAHLREELPDFVAIDNWSALDLGDQSSQLSQLLGVIVVIEQRLPSVVRLLLEKLSDHQEVSWITLQPGDLKVDDSALISCPDPTTEVRLAADFVVKKILEGIAPHEVAVLFSKDQPYAGLLQAQLSLAGINWHGPTADSLGTLTLPRISMLFATMAANRTATSSGIRRIDLMHWFSIAAMTIDGERVNVGALRSFIQSESLFGDARQWLTFLGTFDELIPSEAAQEDGRSIQRAKSAAAASVLHALITRLDHHIEAIATSQTWEAAGASVFNAISEFHLDPRWMKEDQDERSALTIVNNLLTQTLPRIDQVETVRNSSPAAQLPRLLERQFIGRRTKHGSLSSGIHVGPVSSARGLHFKAVAVVGAIEGFLPVSLSDDPVLSDSGRQVLRKNADDLPISSEVYTTLQQTLYSIINASSSALFLYPRGGLENVSDGKPSRYFSHLDSQRCESSLDATLGTLPISSLDQQLQDNFEGEIVAEIAPQVAAGHAWHQPKPGEYFGAAGPGSLDRLTLSASAIEAFLHCPHQFFVSRDLRISTDQYQDDVDVISASDFGTLLHAVFEEFVETASPEQLPDFGTDWPEDAGRRLLSILDAHVEQAKSKGTVGWLPAWDRQYDMVVESLPAFFVEDFQARAPRELRPYKAELSFGMDADQSVSVELEGGAVVYLRGYIDRLDVSKDGTAVGVIDYKSGNSRFFEKSMTAVDIEDRDKVQDLIYDLAARRLFPEVQDVDVNFFFFPNAGEPKLVNGQPIDREALLLEILERMEAVAKTGNYEPRPAKGTDFCPVCKLLGRRATRRSVEDDDAEEDETDE